MLFRIEREEAWVRPLAVALGYLPDLQSDLLHSCPTREIIDLCGMGIESCNCAREVQQDSGKTIYATFFDEDPQYDNVRWGFFNNLKYNVGKRTHDALVQTLRAFVVQFADHEELEAAQLFEDLAMVVEAQFSSTMVQN